MKFLSKDEIASLLSYPELVYALKIGFREGGTVPLRHAHTVTTKQGTENSLLLMPCWQQSGMMGIKLVMVCPDNGQKNLESVQSSYILSDATTGITKAILDGDELTVRRTACASALASSYLSNPNSKSMLMMGTGKLAPYLVKAHASVRNLDKIYIWGRRHEKATELANTLNDELSATVTAVIRPEKYANICDIISCATLASDPILKGKWLNKTKKQHIDLVGGYTYDMREADNDVITTSVIYVDTIDGAMSEAGDLLQPIEQGIISKDDVKGDLYDMVKEDFATADKGKTTLFKSVGTALEDLIAAKLAFNKI